MKGTTYIDLHSHTIYSDGSDTPESLIRAMHMSGVELASVTDHDTLASYKKAKVEADKYGFRIIPGVEISTSKYHILGLNVDPDHAGLNVLLERSQMLQIDECKQRIEKLASVGVPLTLEKLKSTHLPETRLGKWNLVMALYADGTCRNYLQEQYGYLPPPREIFKTYLGKGSIGGKITKQESIRSKEAIRAIHDAGGIAIIAHPFKEIEHLEKELSRLREKEIDGLELQPNYGELNEPFRRYAETHGLMITYGSDFHGPGYDRPLLGRSKNSIDSEILEKMLIRWR